MKHLRTILGAAVLLLAGNLHAQTLIAGWDFSTTANGGTWISTGTMLTGNPLIANFGSGALHYNGANGSSVWSITSSSSTTEARDGAGTTVNGLPGWSTQIGGSAALQTYTRAGNNSISFTIDMSDYEDLTISYAYSRTGSTSSPNSHLWEYSTDGVTWETIGTTSNTSTTSDYFAVSLAPFSGLNDVETAFLRMTYQGGNGSTSNSSFNRIDNIQFNATAVPEPGTCAVVVVALSGLVVMRRSRKSNKA
jgi:hypothetical protein